MRPLPDKRISAIRWLGFPPCTSALVSDWSLCHSATSYTVMRVLHSPTFANSGSLSPGQRPTDLQEVSRSYVPSVFPRGIMLYWHLDITPVGSATGTVKPITRTLDTRASSFHGYAQRAHVLWNTSINYCSTTVPPFRLSSFTFCDPKSHRVAVQGIL